MHRQDRARIAQDPRHQRRARQFLGQAGGNPARSGHRRRRADRGAARARLRGPAGHRQSDGDRRRGAQAPDPRIGCRGLRHDEYHAALGQHLVGRGRADARSVPLALGADCPAGDRLCGPPVLCQRVDGALAPPHQYGRADQHRRDPRHLPQSLRDHLRRRRCLFRFGGDAIVLPARRPRARCRDAHPHAGGDRRAARPDGQERQRDRPRWLHPPRRRQRA